MLDRLSPRHGSRKPRKRVGRGPGSGMGWGMEPELGLGLGMGSGLGMELGTGLVLGLGMGLSLGVEIPRLLARLGTVWWPHMKPTLSAHLAYPRLCPPPRAEVPL